MPRIDAFINLDHHNDRATITIIPVATTELEHELLMELFQDGAVEIVTDHRGDNLKASFDLETKTGSLARAQHRVLNRQRIRADQSPLPEPESPDEELAESAEDGFESVTYPCGCKASGPGPLPTYCPDHGKDK